VSKTGTRCGTRRDLEFHHIVPFARGGAMTSDNLCLMCRAHNALLAERDYGRDYIKSQVAKRQAHASHRSTEPGPEHMNRQPDSTRTAGCERLTDPAQSPSSNLEHKQSDRYVTEQSNPVRT
jgi:hypothetical protein